jgi:membrane-associated phospholipid phosphatase
MPSLHFGWALWCGLVFWRFAAHRRTKSLGLLYPLLTLFSIVVTANHYFLDAVGGAVIIATASILLRVTAIRRWRREAPISVPDAASPTDPALAPAPSPR